MHQSILPQISPEEVAKKRAEKHEFILLDVREENELAIANLGKDVQHLPLSLLREQQEKALPSCMLNKAADIVVFCHHGGRSAQVAAWLISLGWTNVKNLSGGIDAYAISVDSSIMRY